MWLVIAALLFQIASPFVNTPPWCPLPEPRLAAPGDLVAALADADSIDVVQISATDPYTPAPAASLPIDGVTSVHLSDDGQVIVYTRDVAYESATAPEVWTVNVADGEPRLLLDAAALAALRTETFEFAPGIMGIEFIPNTHTIVFNTSVTPFAEGIYVHIADDLHTLNADSGELVTVRAQGEGGAVSVSPDGDTFALMQYSALTLVASDGTVIAEDTLPEYEAVGMGHGVSYPQVVWNADAKSFLIAVVKGDPNASGQHNGMMQTYRVAVDGSEPALVGEFGAVSYGFHISDDGEFATYWRTPEAMSNNREVYVARVDGTEETLLAAGELLDVFSWWPDSRHLIYSENYEQSPLVVNMCGGVSTVSAAQRYVMPQDLWGTYGVITAGEVGFLLADVNSGEQIIVVETLQASDFTILAP